MIFTRKASEQLIDWRTKTNRKPLILRGARQVGKSTLVRDFGSNFKFFIELNLEKSNDKIYFEKDREIKDIWQEILFDKGIPDEPNGTLLFIDEIQEIPHVIKQLRYFYEDLPNLHVIAAGSLLEFSLGKVSSFPVGRVEEMNIFPFDFEEFLMACSENSAVEQLKNVPIANFAYNKLFQLFKRYMIIGGMPEAISSYVESNFSVVGLKQVYSSIWNTYK